MNKYSFFNFCMIMISSYMFGQVGSELPEVSPPSPTAASLGKYGEFPVGYYTGTPNINIPLHTVKSGEIELPISLSYHASGIRVAEEASWVGLGWSLNAGGVIIRQVRGIDDFDSHGYLHRSYDLPEKNTVDKTVSSQYQIITPDAYFTDGVQPSELIIFDDRMKAFSGGHLPNGDTVDNGPMTMTPPQDSEPDIFHYNFFGYSGKLLIKQEGGVLKIFSSDQNNLDFSYDELTKKWTVVDEKGWVYIFGTLEYSRFRSKSCAPYYGTNYSGSYIGETNITGWYIDSVKSPKKDEISFEYGNQLSNNGYVLNFAGINDEAIWEYNSPSLNSPDSRPYFTPTMSSSEYCGYRVDTFGLGCFNNLGMDDPYCNAPLGYYHSRNNTKNYVETKEKFLKKINFNNGYIQFYLNSNTRKDVK